MSRKKFLSLVILVAVLIMSFPLNAFAADEGADDEIVAMSDNTWERTISDVLTVVYRDRANISHTLVFTVSCAAVGGWSEGNYGYVSEAVFFTPTNATIDGQVVTLEKDGVAQKQSSTYIQNYIVNSSEMIVSVIIQCDEYGDITLSAWEV